MFEKMLRSPATTLKRIAVRNFKSTMILNIIICLALGITAIVYFPGVGIVVGVLVIIMGPIIVCQRTYLNTLQILARLEMMENVESIENDTTYIRKRQCDNYMPEPEVGNADTKTCSNCGRRYDSSKTKICPLCETE